MQPAQPPGHASCRSVSGVGRPVPLAEVLPRFGQPDSDCAAEPSVELGGEPARRHPAPQGAAQGPGLPQRGDFALTAFTRASDRYCRFTRDTK